MVLSVSSLCICRLLISFRKSGITYKHHKYKQETFSVWVTSDTYKKRHTGMIYLDVFGELLQLFLHFCIDVLILLQLRLQSHSLLSQSAVLHFKSLNLILWIFFMEFTAVLRHPDTTDTNRSNQKKNFIIKSKKRGQGGCHNLTSKWLKYQVILCIKHQRKL